MNKRLSSAFLLMSISSYLYSARWIALKARQHCSGLERVAHIPMRGTNLECFNIIEADFTYDDQYWHKLKKHDLVAIRYVGPSAKRAGRTTYYFRYYDTDMIRLPERADFSVTEPASYELTDVMVTQESD